MIEESQEEYVLWYHYDTANSNRAFDRKEAISLRQWAQDGIKNPAPLIRWYETEYPKYLARKAKRAS